MLKIIIIYHRLYILNNFHYSYHKCYDKYYGGKNQKLKTNSFFGRKIIIIIIIIIIRFVNVETDPTLG
jgi:hypothetical protein